METAPSGPVVSLQVAAEALNRDRRTLIRAITSGELRGGAMPRPERLRWYVYADELPSASASRATDPVLEDLQAQIVSLKEANRLLIAAQQNLLEVDASTNLVADRWREVARSYLDALAQFVTPGHLGEFTERR